MLKILNKYMRIGILAALFYVCTVTNFAFAASSDWQTLVDEHASLVKQGKHERALEAARKALQLTETDLDIDQKNLAWSSHLLGTTYRDLAMYDKALSIQQHALAIHEKTLGLEHPNNALILDNLALTYVAIGQYDKALLHQQRALAIAEKTFGPEHPDTAMCLSDLAFIYRNLAQFDNARIGYP
jgi:tetratricopeptide (TPR) repeat protein